MYIFFFFFFFLSKIHNKFRGMQSKHNSKFHSYYFLLKFPVSMVNGNSLFFIFSYLFKFWIAA